MSVDSKILLETGTNELEVVEFFIEYEEHNGKKSSQSFGINVAKVREIIRLPQLTILPHLPKSVLGVFNLRDKIIPALDLSKYLYGKTNISDNKKMIIAEFNKMSCGFLVNDVYRIHRISWTQIESPDAMQEFDSQNSTIIGIIKFEDRNILMVDIEKIIADVDPSSAMDGSVTKKMMDWKPIAVTAEDSSTIRKMITERLKIAGFEIVSFNDGAEAWQFLDGISKSCKNAEELKEKVNIVITDIEMPRMDGYTLTKLIKSDTILKSLPVVIFSSIVSGDVMHKGKAVGADAQLTKPQIGELLDVLRHLLDIG